MTVDPMGVLALQRALTQASDLLDAVTPDDLGRPTPCADWDVRDLANHLIAQPRIFVTMLQGSRPGGTAVRTMRSTWGRSCAPAATRW